MTSNQEPEEINQAKEDSIEQDVLSEDGAAPENSELQQELEVTKQQLADFQDKLVRMQAEMDNQRKRADKKLEDAHKYSIEKFSKEVLQIKDSLELGLSADNIDVQKLQEGTELTLKMLVGVLSKFEIAELNPLGEAFDPNLHQAMTTQESEEFPPNTVLTVVQKGYTLHERLIRPAMVIVAKAPGS